MITPKLLTKTVTVVDNASTGELMRAIRKIKNISIRELARRLGVSAVYVSDLELGRRNWTDKKISQFRKALKI